MDEHFRERLPFFASSLTEEEMEEFEHRMWVILDDDALYTLKNLKVVSDVEWEDGVYADERRRRLGYFWRLEAPDEILASGAVEVDLGTPQADLSRRVLDAVTERLFPWRKGKWVQIPDTILEFAEEKVEVLNISASAPWMDEDPVFGEYPAVDVVYAPSAEVSDVSIRVKKIGRKYKIEYAVRFSLEIRGTKLQR